MKPSLRPSLTQMTSLHCRLVNRMAMQTASRNVFGKDYSGSHRNMPQETLTDLRMALMAAFSSRDT